MKIRDVSLWESFYWVAKDGNFTRAAKRLHVGLPLLSKRIGKLESNLGARLFHRSTRKMSLTQEGREILPLVESFLGDAQDLESRLAHRSEIAGTIRLTCVTALAHRKMAPLITEFLRIHPKIRFELEITDILVDLIDHQIDLAIRVQEPRGADLVFKNLFSNDLVLCASPRYLKGAKKPLGGPSDLAFHPILTLEAYKDCRFKKTGITVESLFGSRTVSCESGFFLTELACQGAGIAIRSIWDVAPLLKSGRLVQVLKGHPLEPFGSMYAVIPNRRLLSPRVRAFIDFLEPALKKSMS